jgi:hypothetical protein
MTHIRLFAAGYHIRNVHGWGRSVPVDPRTLYVGRTDDGRVPYSASGWRRLGAHQGHGVQTRRRPGRRNRHSAGTALESARPHAGVYSKRDMDKRDTRRPPPCRLATCGHDVLRTCYAPRELSTLATRNYQGIYSLSMAYLFLWSIHR